MKQLDWAYPGLRVRADAGSDEQAASSSQDRPPSSAGAVDLLGILSASQVLSSETSLGRLHARVGEVLAAMTGATGVSLLLWDEERQDWLPAGGGGLVPAEGAVPVSVLRYLRRTREPVIVGDTTVDDRFAADLGRGTGLVGLKDRVEALGGVIAIESTPGRGTLLRAELPLTDQLRAAGLTRGPPRPCQADGFHVGWSGAPRTRSGE